MKSYDIVEWGKPLQVIVHDVKSPVGTQVRLRVIACGVCHSDLHIADGYLDLGNGKSVSFSNVGLKLPFTLGHEIVGVVDAVGAESTAVIGMKCVVYPWIGCGACRHCTNGNELHCEKNVALGTREAGGYSEYVMVPHERYLLDFGDIDEGVAATCACSGLTAYSALKKLPQYGPDDTILLLGAGGLGLAALGLVSAVTSAKVVVADIDDGKLALAKEFGASQVVNVANEDALQVLKSAVGEGVRGVIDFVGAGKTVDFSLQAVGKGGTVVIVGLFGGALTLSTALLPMRNISIKGSYVGTLDEMKELLTLMRDKHIHPVPVIERPMTEINDIHDDLRNGRVNGRIIARNF